MTGVTVPGLSDRETFRTNNSVRQIAETIPKLATLDAAAMTNVTIDGLTITGAADAPTKAPLDSSDSIATTAYVDAADLVVSGVVSSHTARTDNPHAVTKAQVGLGNVANTAPADLPVSTATQDVLDLKAPLASPALTGVPTAPTASAGTATTQIATTAFVGSAVTWTFVGKTADQARATSTPAADTELKFAADANSTYVVRGAYWVSTSGASGCIITINAPGTPARVRGMAIGGIYTTANGGMIVSTTAAFNVVVPVYAEIETGATAGDVYFGTARGAASGTTTFERGSWIEWSKIG